ncbi:MAG TPA: hypothetical protein VMB66_11510, partial [Candidatus Acidoferrales bacterium]|nr:hypothetical protein [Candidatus Acidoferrales bacterium]
MKRAIQNRSFRAISSMAGVLAVCLLAMAAKPAPKQSQSALRERYLSPLEMVFSPDGRVLYVLCQDSDEVKVIDVASATPINSIPVGHVPRGIALSPDARRLYVTNAWSDTVSV